MPPELDTSPQDIIPKLSGFRDASPRGGAMHIDIVMYSGGCPMLLLINSEDWEVPCKSIAHLFLCFGTSSLNVVLLGIASLFPGEALFIMLLIVARFVDC